MADVNDFLVDGIKVVGNKINRRTNHCIMNYYYSIWETNLLLLYVSLLYALLNTY